MVVRQKKARRTELGSPGIQKLPEDLLLKILCKIPAEELLSICKCVCKSWSRLLDSARYNLSFINSNLLHSTPYAILHNARQRRTNLRCSNILAARLKRPQRSSTSATLFETHEFYLDWMKERISDTNFCGYWLNGRICATSSDGALLIILFCSNHNFCVVNPLTRQLLELPEINHFPYYGAIARIPDTGKFKVLTYGKEEANGSGVWYVITVGTNMSWRKLINHPSEFYPSAHHGLLEHWSVSINGVIYVPFAVDHPDSDFTFVAFDLNNETAFFLEIPTECRVKCHPSLEKSFELLHMGDNLGFAGVEYRSRTIRIWILKNFHPSEWTLILNLDLSESIQSELSLFIKPRVWFPSSRALVMCLSRGTFSRSHRSYCAYFVDTKKLQRLKKTCINGPSFMHRYSLTPLY